MGIWLLRFLFLTSSCVGQFQNFNLIRNEAKGRAVVILFGGIICPELSTKEGQSVKRFIESRIKPNDFVIIKTHRDDKYGRYLVDICYAPAGEKWSVDRVAAEGVYLNQELLDNRLAVVMRV